jgi:hypothetical protein
VDLQINRNSLWHGLSEHQQFCVKRGLPIKYLGMSLRDDTLKFVDYEIPQSFAPLVVSGVTQSRWLQALKSTMSPAKYPVGIVGIHSSPTDHSAFKVGASIFEMAVHRGLVCHCLSITQIKENRSDHLPQADVYLIHGLTDEVVSSYTWPLRDFLRSKSTALRLLLMTSPTAGGGLQMQRETLRMRDIDVTICLEDSDDQPGLRYT